MTDNDTTAGHASLYPLRYWRAYCTVCDWWGPDCECIEGARADREAHIDEHGAGRLGVHVLERTTEEVE